MAYLHELIQIFITVKIQIILKEKNSLIDYLKTAESCLLKSFQLSTGVIADSKTKIYVTQH